LRGFLTAVECTKSVFSRGSAPDPAEGAHDAPPDPLVGWRGEHPLPIAVPIGTYGASIHTFGVRLGALGASLPAFRHFFFHSLSTVLSECLRILIDCGQLSKTYYNVFFSSSTRDRHARRIIISADVQRITLNASSCITISGGRTKQLDIGLIAGFLPRHWFYK